MLPNKDVEFAFLTRPGLPQIGDRRTQTTAGLGAFEVP
jgi:hypothetical protein